MIPNFDLIEKRIQQLIVLDGDNPEELRARIVKLVRQISVESDHPIQKLKAREIYRRYEDMSPDGHLSLMLEDDGDIIVEIHQSPKDPKNFRRAEVQFCAYSGGGRSQRVREALIELAVAIQEENIINPQRREKS